MILPASRPGYSSSVVNAVCLRSVPERTPRACKTEACWDRITAVSQTHGYKVMGMNRRYDVLVISRRRAAICSSNDSCMNGMVYEHDACIALAHGGNMVSFYRSENMNVLLVCVGSGADGTVYHRCDCDCS